MWLYGPQLSPVSRKDTLMVPKRIGIVLQLIIENVVLIRISHWNLYEWLKWPNTRHPEFDALQLKPLRFKQRGKYCIFTISNVLGLDTLLCVDNKMQQSLILCGIRDGKPKPNYERGSSKNFQSATSLIMSAYNGCFVRQIRVEHDFRNP